MNDQHKSDREYKLFFKCVFGGGWTANTNNNVIIYCLWFGVLGEKKEALSRN